MNLLGLISNLIGFVLIAAYFTGIRKVNAQSATRSFLKRIKIGLVFLSLGLLLQFSGLLTKDMALFNNPLKEKITSKNASKYLNQICEDLNESACSELREEFKMPFLVYNADHTGPAAVVVLYDKPLDQITFEDLVLKIDKSNVE